MSKKKAAGSTMTLKDFHGGSIPSDLPLPSAPGVVPKITTDRPVFDRGPWGTSSVGRTDQGTRPSSSHIIRNFDDKSLFLPHSANIGRNFTEDERKPLDGHSAPRRMVSDDVFRVANSRLEMKADSVLIGRHSGWSATGPFPRKMNDVTHSMTGTGENSVSGTLPNVWNGRKEVPVVANNEPRQSPWTTQPAVSSLVHGNAHDQVPSGRWQSKLLGPSQIGFDIEKNTEIGNRYYKTTGPMLNQGDEPHVEHGLVPGAGVQGGKKFSHVYEKTPDTSFLEVKEAKIVANSSNKPHPNYSDFRSAGHLVQPSAPSEVVERPKLNLLPRTKLLESVEKHENDASNLIQPDRTQKSMQIPKPGLSAAEISNQPIERPKLNLKPVTQRLEQLEVKTEKERNAVFGGARPRELVLKERGIDEPEHHDLEQPLERMVVKPIERVTDHAIQRPMSSPRDLRTRKIDQSVNENVRSETQRRNWRENDTKNSRQQQQTQEKTRHPSPETWRKPVIEKPESPDGTGIRHGKAASALELAQAYSPFSDPRSGTGSNSFNPSRNNQTRQQPFSRLVGSTTTPRQINGY